MVCLTVVDVERFDCWRSVVVIGSARWVSGAAGRTAAIRAFVRQRRPAGALSASAAARLVSGRAFRIEVEELSGRANGAADRAVAVSRPLTG